MNGVPRIGGLDQHFDSPSHRRVIRRLEFDPYDGAAAAARREDDSFRFVLCGDVFAAAQQAAFDVVSQR